MAPPPRRRLLDAAWFRIIGHPAPGQPFRTGLDLDLLRVLRYQSRLLSTALLAFVALLGALALGIAVPTWVVPTASVLLAWGFLAFTPDARNGLLSSLVMLRRPTWTDAWLAAGCPFPHLWRMLRPPVPVEVFAAYHAALTADPDDTDDEHSDPWLVWYCHAHGIDPQTAAAYRAAGARPDEIPLLVAAHVSPAQWTRLAKVGSGRQVVALLGWLTSGRGALHPTQFTDPTPTVDWERAQAAVAAWNRVGLDLYYARRCPDQPARRRGDPRALGVRCETCGAVGAEHRLLAAERQMTPERYTVAEWVEATGVLAPWFLAAGIGIEEARRLCTQNPETLSVGSLAALAALTGTGRD